MDIIGLIKRFIFGRVVCDTDSFELYVEKVRAVMNYEFDIIIATIDADSDGFVDVSEAYEAVKGLGKVFKRTTKQLKESMNNVK